MVIDFSPSTSDSPAKTDQESERRSYKLKKIAYNGKKKLIVLQNTNGSCPLIALCNNIILGDPRNLNLDASEISEDELLNRVGKKLLFPTEHFKSIDGRIITKPPSGEVSDAKALLPKLASEINVNPILNSIKGFGPTPELKIFKLFNIPYYHGWIVDPQDSATASIIGNKSYDDLTTRLAALKERQALEARSSQISGECSETTSSAKHKKEIPLLLTLTPEEKNQFGFVINSDSSSDEKSVDDTLVTSVDAAADCVGTRGSGISAEDETDSDVVKKICVEEEVPSTSTITEKNVALDHELLFLTKLRQTVFDLETEYNSKVTSSEENTNVESTEKDSTPEVPLMSEAVTTANPDISGRSHDDDEGDNSEDINVELTPEEGEVIQRFLDDNRTQLTHHGISALKDGVEEGEPCIFFRNNHFFTMLKFTNELYLLVTDEGYLTQKDLVWEKLNEVSGNSVYMTGDFSVFVSESQKWDQEHAFSDIADNIKRLSREELENDSNLKMAVELQEKELRRAGHSEVQSDDNSCYKWL